MRYRRNIKNVIHVHHYTYCYNYYRQKQIEKLKPKPETIDVMAGTRFRVALRKKSNWNQQFKEEGDDKKSKQPNGKDDERVTRTRRKRQWKRISNKGQ
jgi:hypothetical protein